MIVNVMCFLKMWHCTIGCVIYHLMCWCKSWASFKVHHLILWSIKSRTSWSYDTSHGYFPPYKPLVVAHTNPSFSNDYILFDVPIGVYNSQGPHNACEVAFKWQEDWVYHKKVVGRLTFVHNGSLNGDIG
jgi:hypothetical protein